MVYTALSRFVRTVLMAFSDPKWDHMERKLPQEAPGQAFFFDRQVDQYGGDKEGRNLLAIPYLCDGTYRRTQRNATLSTEAT